MFMSESVYICASSLACLLDERGVTFCSFIYIIIKTYIANIAENEMTSKRERETNTHKAWHMQN